MMVALDESRMKCSGAAPSAKVSYFPKKICRGAKFSLEVGYFSTMSCIGIFYSAVKELGTVLWPNECVLLFCFINMLKKIV